ncbi:hypothetical protein ACFSHP_25550 [Novosphingobium panipatense]
MDRSDVIPVQTVFHLHLPVAAIAVPRSARQHLHFALLRLVDQQIDERLRAGQIFLEWQDIGRQAAEDEAAVNFQTGDPGKSEIGAVEARRITPALLR